MIRQDPQTRMLVRSLCRAALAVNALGVAAAMAQQPAPASAETPPIEMQKIVVTGSLLPTVDTVGPSPVLMFDREKIEETGYATVSELLRKLPQNTGPSFDEVFQNSFAPGSSGVSLRGLGQQNTLVLMNGRRLAPYGFGQNINEVFVDLNSLPLAAIERVEVLKDGASALYGSDAIAGVVNLIMREGYEGTEVNARYGNTTDKDATEYSFSLVTGISDGKSSAMVVADYYRREAVYLRDRDYSASANHEWQGGYNLSSGLGPDPGVFYSLDGSDIPGYDSYRVRVNPNGTISEGGGNLYDYNPALSGIPETTRYGFVGMFDHELADWVDLFAEVSYRNVNTYTEAAATPIVGDRAPDLYGYGGRSFIIPATNPYNPFGTDVTFRKRFLEGGPRINEIETDAVRTLFGLKFHLGRDWEAETAFMWNKNKTSNKGDNYLNADRVNDALFQTDPNLALNVFDPYAYWDPANRIANNPDVIDGIKVATTRLAETQLMMGDVRLYGPLVDVPAGTVNMFIGAEGRRESLDDRPDPVSAGERIVSSGGTGTTAERDAAAIYTELSIPLISPDQDITAVESFDAQVAVRFDNYSDFGTSVTPKFGAKWQPVKDVALRGSYGQGFRAPSLIELYNGGSVSYPFVVDSNPASPLYDIPAQYRTVSEGNPDLNAAKSESFSAGILYQPSQVEGLTVYVDWWKIDYKDAIDSFSPQYVVDNFPGRVVRDPVTEEIQTIFTTYENLATRRTSGVDFGLSYDIDTGSAGVVTVGGDATYLLKFEDQAAPGEEFSDLAGTFYYPEWRAVGSVFWKYKRYGLGVTLNYIGEYEQYYMASEEYVDRWITVDLQASVELPKDFTITVGVLNVADEDPPFSDSDTEGYDIATHSMRGRFYYVNVSKKF